MGYLSELTAHERLTVDNSRAEVSCIMYRHLPFSPEVGCIAS